MEVGKELSNINITLKKTSKFVSTGVHYLLGSTGGTLSLSVVFYVHCKKLRKKQNKSDVIKIFK
jgi:hypothetical protein